MRLTVNKAALEDAIKTLIENRTGATVDISDIPAKDDDPITPMPQMATQFTIEKPPVEDPEYVPSSVVGLSNAASAISAEVPPEQIEYYYRKLHQILDNAIDRQRTSEFEPTYEEEQTEAEDVEFEDISSGGQPSDGGEEVNISESLSAIRSTIQEILKESSSLGDSDFDIEMDGPTDEELDQIEYEETEEEEDSSVANIGQISASDISEFLISLGYDKIALPASENPEDDAVAVYPKVMWQAKNQNDPFSGRFVLGEEEMTVLIRAGLARKQFAKAMEFSSELRSMFEKYKEQEYGNVQGEELVKATSEAWKDVERDFGSRLGKEGNPITLELAAEMFANVSADNISKAIQGDAKQYAAALEAHINSLSDPVIVNFSGTRLPENKNIQVPKDVFVGYLRASQPKDIFVDDDIESEDDNILSMDPATYEKELKQREKAEIEKLADELSEIEGEKISVGGLRNLAQDLAVALGPRLPGMKKRAPDIRDFHADQEESLRKMAYALRLNQSIANKFIDMVSSEIILDEFIESKNLDRSNLSEKDLGIAKKASREIAQEIVGYNSDTLTFNTKDMSAIFRGGDFKGRLKSFLHEFSSEIAKDFDGPLFDALPDYLDFREGRGEFIGRDDFTEKDVRETAGSVKDFSSLVRGITNVGYELEARANLANKKANSARDQGDAKSARRYRKESQEYESEAMAYLDRSREVSQAIDEWEVPAKLIKRYSKLVSDFITKNIRSPGDK